MFRSPAASRERPLPRIYARVSTEEQGSKGVGLAAQRSAIKAECARRGWKLVRIEEDVLSGKNLNRPGLRAALDACRRGRSTGSWSRSSTG